MTAQLLLSVTDAAKALGIGRTKAWQLANTHEIESVRIGGRVLIPVQGLEDYVARLRMEQS